MSTDAGFAWAVGLFEGEGSIIYSKAATGYTARKLMLDSTDRDVVERFGRTVGVGRVSGPHRRGRSSDSRRRETWRWEVARWTEVEPLLTRMLPLLGERRAAWARVLLGDAPHHVWSTPRAVAC